MSITVELLDALLSPAAATPGGGLSPREQAEAYLSSMDVADRARGLLSLLLQLQQQQPNDTNSNIVGRHMMACVLLRRDICRLGGVQQNAASDASTLLKEMVDPTLSLFLGSSMTRPCRRQVGHCLAEICASLFILSPATTESDEAVKCVLSRIAHNCCEADVESIRLVTCLADRAPLTFWRSTGAANLAQLFQSATAATTEEEGMEALVEAVVSVGITAQLATTTQNDPSSTLLLGAAAALGTTDNLKVDPSSPVTQLGRSCLVPLFDMMVRSISSTSNDDYLNKCMQHLSQSATSCPSLLAADAETFSSLIRTCMMVASSSGQDETTRLAALEVLATLTDVGAVKRNRLSSSATPQGQPQPRNMLLLGEGVGTEGVIRICAELIVNGVDDGVEGWAADPATLVDDAAAWEEDDTAVYAESLLEMFLHNLGGGTHSLPVVLPLVEMLLSDGSNQWKHQRAALSILERCLSAAPVTFARHVPVAVETALQLSRNGSVRVQFQAMNLLGALCDADDALGADVLVRKQYGSRILETIARLVQSNCTKVASVASLSIVSYCRGGSSSNNSDDDDGKTLVVPYLKDLLMALVAGPLSLQVTSGAAVHGGAVAVKVRAIGAVACLAEASGEAFVPFYGNVMPGLLACAQLPASVNSHELSQLRGAAIEAATIVGQAIGESNRELFLVDAEQIMKLALPLLHENSSAVIPMDQLLAACSRIASVIGDSYAPFIESVLPHLLNRAMEPPDVAITEGDEAGLEATRRGGYEMDQDEGTESMTVALPGRGLKKVTINTTKMQEKALAARAVYEHAAALGASFGPYAEASLQAFLPLVNFKYSSEVRSTAAQALSAVFEGACAYDAKSVLVQKYLPLSAKAIAKQILEEDTADMEVLYALADSLSEIYYAAFCRLTESEGRIITQFSIEDANSTVTQLMKSMAECLNRRTKLTRTIEGYDGALTGEDERREYSEMLQSERDLLTPLVDSVGYTLKFFREKFLPIFDSQVAPVLAPYLGVEGNADVRACVAAVCLFDDCVEHCGSVAAAKHSPKLANGIMFGLREEQDSDLKRASVYGIAQIARYAPSNVLAAQAQSIVHRLLAICNVSKEDADDVFLLENSVSALASLVLFGTAPFAGLKFIDKNSVAQTFLQNLPLLEDYDEAQICHAGLCDLIENGSINVETEAPTILKVIGETLACVSDGEEIASPDTCSRFAEILFRMQHGIPADRMQQSFAAVPLEAQNAISAVMEQHAFTRNNVVTP